MEETLLDRFTLWEDVGIRADSQGSFTQTSIYYDNDSNKFIHIHITHGAEAKKCSVPFLTVVKCSWQAPYKSSGKTILKASFLSHEEALQRIINEDLI